ncbi:MAG: hypothetical protein WCT46_02520 [Candidatus Gracilibacteria bacterium]
MENDNGVGRVESEDQAYKIWVEDALAKRRAGALEEIQMPGTTEPEVEEDSSDGMDEIDIREGRTSTRDQLRRL